MNGQPDQFFVIGTPPQSGSHAGQTQGEEISPELVVSLIEKFYNKSSLPPSEIARINTLLVQVQVRNASLDLPEKLLQFPSSTVRFYAAGLLETLASRLSPDLSEEKKDFVKSKYIQYVSFAVSSGFGFVEFAKLSQACVSLYIAVRDWPDCFRQLFHSVFGDSVHEFDRLSRLSCTGQKLAEVPPVHRTDKGMSELMSNNGENELQALINALDDNKAVLIVNFMGTLVEVLEPTRMQLPEIEKVKVNESFISTCQSIVPVLSAMMNKQSLLKSKISPTAVISAILKHTMFLASSNPADVESKVEYLIRSVWLQVLQKLTSNPDGATWKSVEDVMDSVFRLHRSWVDQETLNDLLDFAMEPHVGLVKHSLADQETLEDDEMQLAARRMCKDIASHALEAGVIDSSKAENFLQLINYMSTSLELDDDKCEWAGQVVQFWTDYTEKLSEIYEYAGDNYDIGKLERLLQPMLHAITYIFPNIAIPEDPDEDLADTLLEIQVDAQSLFAQAYLLFQGKLGKLHGRNPIPGMIMQTEPNSSLYGVATPELAVKTLSGLAENFLDDPRNDATICLVFTTRLFEPLADAYELTAPLKSREVDACIELLENYAPMLARNPQHLARAMEFLFSVLDANMNAHDPEVGKAMKAICLASRKQLVPHFNSLVARYQDLQERGLYFPEAKVNILASLGIVAHAVDKANGNLNAIKSAIQIIEEEVEMFLSIPDPEENTFTQDGLDALQAILELGRLIRSGSTRDTAIPLDDDDQSDKTSAASSPLYAQLQELQSLITNLMSTLASSPLLDNNDEAFRTICDTLRLTQRHRSVDMHAAIFDFGPQIFLEVLKLCITRNVSADYSLDTFGQMLVMKYSQHSNDDVAVIARETFPLCIQYMDSCTQVDDGGDSLNGPLKLLLTYLDRCGDIVESHAGEFSRIVDLVTPSIRSSNVFTQEAACDVWRMLLRSHEAFLSNVSAEQLQTLALSLVQQIAGEALERAITPLSGVLAAMGARGGPCKAALEDAFRQLEAQGVKVANWTRFVQQVFLLRGNGLDTRKATEQFWKADRLAKAQVDGADESEEEVEIVLLGDD